MGRVTRWLDFHNRTILSAMLLAAFAWSLLSVGWERGLLHARGLATAWEMVGAFFRPDLSAEILSLAVIAAWRTLAYAMAGMTLAVALAVPLGVAASGVLCSGRLARLMSGGAFRSLLGLMRSVHELVWAWLFVAAIGLSPLAAIFALAIPYGGILGRIFADMLNDVPAEPLGALRSAGAGELKVLLYGRIPMALANILSYTFYRFECAIRSAAIMSFVGLGGLGYQIQISLDDLHYNEVWTFVFFLVAVVFLVDVWSTKLRSRMVS